jgi:4-carboxymuconolactone decarboxylase
LWDAIMALSLETQGPNAVLSPRVRELAALRTAWLVQAPYEWGEHVKHGKHIGLSAEEIEWIVIGSTAPGWDDFDRAVMRASEELHEDAMVSDATWAKLGERLNDHQRVEMLTLIGQFTMVAYIQNSLRLRLEPSNPGLSAR